MAYQVMAGCKDFLQECKEFLSHLAFGTRFLMGKLFLLWQVCTCNLQYLFFQQGILQVLLAGIRRQCSLN